MNRWIRGLILALALLLGAGTAVTACGHPAYVGPVADPTPFDGTPGTPVMINGMQYCGWMYSQSECSWSAWPAAPVAIPMTMPLASDPSYAMLNALFAWHLTYHAFFGSGLYYDRYLSPYYSSHPGVTVINRNTYINNSQSFDSKYSSQEKSAESTGSYKDKSGKTTPANKVPQNAFSGGNQKPTNGGNAPAPSGGKAPAPTGGKAPAPTNGGKAPAPAPKPAPAPAPRPRH
jgi:hypothetical protein